MIKVCRSLTDRQGIERFLVVQQHPTEEQGKVELNSASDLK